MESVSFSFLRIPKAFLVRFFNPEGERSTKKKAILIEPLKEILLKVPRSLAGCNP